MPARPGESEEEYRKRREAEKRSSRPKETEEERAARKAREAAEGKSSRPKETEEERAARKAREAAEGKSSRPKETEEERAARKAREAAEGKSSRPKETEEERAARKAKEREREAAESKSSRPKETEEERAARKAREAAEGKSSRPKETEEERAARKAKERERERQKEAERSEKKVVRVEANIGSVHKSSTSNTAGDDKKSSPAEEKKVQARPVPQAQKDDDDDDDYGDDDFVDAAEAEALERARKAMEAENERIRKAMAARRGESSTTKGDDKAGSSSSKTPRAGADEVSGTSQISVEDLSRQKYRAQFEADLARATALRRLVDLESVSVTIADIAPMSEYDLYIRSFGGSERVQTAVQAPPESDIHDQEVQAERVVVRHKGSQVPEDLGLFPERQMVKGFGFGANRNNNNADDEAVATTAAKKTRKDKSEKDKDGGKGESENEKESKKRSKSKTDDNEKVASTSDAGTQASSNNKTNPINNLLSFDTVALSSFLTRVFPVVRSLLDETDTCRAVNASTVNKTEHPFSSAMVELKTPLVQGRSVVETQFSKAAPQNVLVLYGPTRAEATAASSSTLGSSLAKYPSVAIMWNVNDPLTTDRVLLSTAPLTSVCCSPTRPHLIYGGTASGSVCVWDLREPNYRHTTLPDGTTTRLPSFSTEWLSDNHDYPVVQVVVAGYNSSLAHRSKDEAETLTSVDAKGGCFFWMVNEDVWQGSRAGGAAAGGSSPMGSPTAASSPRTDSKKVLSPDSTTKRKAGLLADNDHGQNLFSSVKLFRASSMNLLPPNARADAVSCCEFFPSDPTQLVAGSSEVVHVNRYGSITAPNVYKHYARWSQTSSTSPVTSLNFSPLDSRVLLASYQDGSVRLFLKDSAEPKLTIPLAANGAISRVRCSPSLRWVTFALDSNGTFYTLDHASNNKKNIPIQKALMSNMSNGKCVAFDVSDEERVESRLIFGYENGLLQVHTIDPEAIRADPNERNERWL